MPKANTCHHLVVPTSNTTFLKKNSLGTQIFARYDWKVWDSKYYDKFWLVNCKLEKAPTYKKSHNASDIWKPRNIIELDIIGLKIPGSFLVPLFLLFTIRFIFRCPQLCFSIPRKKELFCATLHCVNTDWFFGLAFQKKRQIKKER